jgi:hypothetical protein
MYCSSSSPSDYLGVMGLSEAFLYAARLYMMSVGNNTTTQHNSLTVAAVDDASNLIEAVNNVLQQGYGSDLLMRSLPTWLPVLDELSKHTYQAIKNVPSVTDAELTERDFVGCDQVFGSEMNHVGDLSASYKKLYHSSRPAVPAYAMPHAHPQAVAQTHTDKDHLYFTLNNGLHMPAIGLGTCKR